MRDSRLRRNPLCFTCICEGGGGQTAEEHLIPEKKKKKIPQGVLLLQKGVRRTKGDGVESR